MTLDIPCGIGDTVFIIGRKYRTGRYETFINTGKFRLSDIARLGKTVFLKKEDAEKALNEWRIKDENKTINPRQTYSV